MLASVPSAPTVALTQDYSAAGHNQIAMTYSMDASLNGGSPILGYQIWRDNGQGGDLEPLFELDSVLAVSYIDYGLVNGREYRYKYRARNINGWGAFSAISYLVAADVPSKPPTPILSAVNDTYIVVNLTAPSDNGGSSIIDYALYVDDGTINGAFTIVGNYTGSRGQHELTSANSITPGNTYRFKWVTRSIVGFSDESDWLRVGFGVQASQPANLEIDIEYSSSGTITVKWDSVSGGTLPILGYILEMKEENYETIYDGTSDPDTTRYTVTGLTPGAFYQFRVYSQNFNGPSIASTTLGAYACGRPSGFDAPIAVSTTSESIYISWNAPSDNGGCSIQDYAVYRDEDGTGTTYTEVNPSSSYTRNDPFTTVFNVTTFPTGAAAGDKFMFKIESYNIQTSFNSSVSSLILLASVPGTPSAAPQRVDEDTNGNQVTVSFQSVSDSGGSSIISYELQMGDGNMLNYFQTVSGVDPTSLSLSFTVTRNIVKGTFYAFRYRAVNSVGPGDWSPLARVQAGTVPPAPSSPTFVSATTSSVTLAFSDISDNGGSEITSTKIFRDAGNYTSDINIEVTAYSGESQYEVTGLTNNTLYNFAYVAANGIDSSAQSIPVLVQTSTQPKQLSAPLVDRTQSSKTSLYIYWSSVEDYDANITGYVLAMDDGLGGAFVDVFDGQFQPDTLSFLVSGLTTGRQYRFKVRARGYNQDGIESAIASFYACVAPSDFASPTRVSSTKESIQVQWDVPGDDGGCPISGYAVFRDDGTDGDVTVEVNSDNDTAVRGSPYVTSLNITSFPSNSGGNTFRIKVTSFNVGGLQADSSVAVLVLASLPGTPTVGPVNDDTVTSCDRIRVTYGTTPPDDGGSPILSYSLEIDDGQGRIKVVGFNSNSLLTAYTITSGIENGRTYRLVYRVKNAVGWGEYSPETSILAADVPESPPEPTFNRFDSTNNTMYLNIQPSTYSTDSLGVTQCRSSITKYELYRDTGLSFTSDFTKITDITPGALEYAAVEGTDDYTIGRTYRFKVIAVNSVGSSEASDEAYIAFGDHPGQPTAINAALATTTRTTITVTWDAVTADLSITGYIINMDDGRLGELSPAYVGTNRPDLRVFTATGLETGLSYRFSVQAINSNGVSIQSATTTIYACDTPSGLAAPIYVSSNQSDLTIDISWDAPPDDGGCPVTGFEVYYDDGVNGEVKISTIANNDPSINSASMTFSSGTIGDEYLFSVRSLNQAGYTQSNTIKIALASLPSPPSTAPTSDSDFTNTERLKVLIAPLTTNAETGGSAILRYEVQISGLNGDQAWYTIYTLSPSLIFTNGISRGENYRVRYRAENVNGWGNYSDTSLLKAATIPSKPLAPVYDATNSDSDTITLSFAPPDNGASEISYYLLYMDEVSSTSSPELVYNGSSLSYSVEAATYTNVSGDLRFYLQATNEFGTSEASQETYAAFGTKPNKPDAPFKIELESTLTSITVGWAESPAVFDISPSGYLLYSDLGLGGSLELIYDGSTRPNTLQYQLGGLTTGLSYKFAIKAVNINGESDISDTSEIFACLKPSNLEAPIKVTSSKTSITIQWEEPEDNGCPIQSYSIFRDNAGTGSIDIEVDSSTVRNKPSLREYEVTSLSPTGSTFRFRVNATNSAGYTQSSPMSAILASVPDTPTAQPTSDDIVTDDTKIKVDITPLLSTENGGSTILSYNIEMDNGQGGNFTSLVGYDINSLETTYTIESGIEAGVMYRFRYAAKNIAGWSGYSPITYIRAAAKPVRPPAPIFVTATAESIELQLSPTTDVKGSIVTRHELWVNSGGGSNSFTNVTSFSGNPGNVNVTLTDGLTAGSIYKFKHRAINELGESDYSDTIDAGVSDFPDAPTTLEVKELTQYVLEVNWTASSDKDLPVLGYQLQRDDGYSGEFITIYDGTNFPSVRQYTATGLIRGLTYKFVVKAINFNGASSPSSELEVTYCNAPTGLAAPTLLSSTNTTLTLQWTAPEDDGGCPVTQYLLYRDDGTGSPANIDIVIDQSTFLNEPSLREHQINFTDSDKGTSFRFQLVATAVSSVTSEEVAFVVAAIPDTPTTAPTSDPDDTSGSQIKVLYAALSTSENGGSDITSYELFVYNTTTSSWISLIGAQYEPSLSNSFIVEDGIEIGETYAFRYRARNVNGPSNYSDIGYLVAAEAPSQPAPPQYEESTDTTLTLSFTPPSSNGGSIITNYILEYSPFATINWQNVTTYTDNSMSHTLNISDGLVAANQKYRFRISAKNAYGTSDPSSESVASIGSLPSQLSSPSKDQLYSSKNSIKVYWSHPSDSEPTTGYLLYMADVTQGGNYSVIYDGSANPIRDNYTVTGLTPGNTYGFKVQAINFNGEGIASQAAEFQSCEGPSELAVPIAEEVYKTNITFSWSEPSETGGCNITSYALLMDDGAGGTLSAVSSSDIENKPSLRRYTLVFADSADTGKTFRFRLQATNVIDSALSAIISVVLAEVPATPAAGPTRDTSNTNANQIALDWAVISDTGGSPITSYELQMSPPGYDEFFTVIGLEKQYLDTSYIVTTNITKGKDHRFIYRSQNAAGWSKISPISYVRAATKPDPPSAPILLSYNSTHIEIGFSQTQDDGGSPVTQNYLYIGEEVAGETTFTLVQAYDNTSSTYMFATNDTTPLIETGKVYRIKYEAVNDFGVSETDAELTAGVGAKPTAPTGLAGDTVENDPTVISISWTAPASSDLTILGYLVQMDDGLGGDYSIVYEGYTNPQVTTYTAQKLEPGRQYKFKVQAVDINGAGDESSEIAIYACVKPSGLDRPVITGTYNASFAVSWSNPIDNGGCTVQNATVYIDDGNGGDIDTVVVTVTDGSLSYNDTTTLSLSNRGTQYRVAVTMKNIIGSVTSSATLFTLADIPASPTPEPQVDSEYTNTVQIRVSFVNSNADIGGAQIEEQ